MTVPLRPDQREPFASIDAEKLARVEAAKARHATMLARTDNAGLPLYRVTEGGNVVRTRPITQRLKAKILARDGHACVECSSTELLEVAHIEDYRVNGNNDPSNLRILCHDCHAAETVSLWVEAAKEQRERWRQYLRESMIENGFTGDELDEIVDRMVG